MGADIEAGYDPFGDLVSLASGEWNAGFKRDEMGLEIERLLPGNLRKQTERDRLGRITGQNILKGYTAVDKKSYLWGVNDRLLSVIDNGKERQYEYDGKGYLTRTLFEDGTQELRCPDRSGNLYESLDRKDRKYARGGQLVKTADWEYKYDEFGNMVRKKKQWGETWRYRWNAAGMLTSVVRPDSREVQFKYDALGRRIGKRFGNIVTRWVWDGNVPLHEWKENWRRDYEPGRGEFWNIAKQPLVTWVFEAGTFVPAAKLTEKERYSIVANYMGTPEAMYQEDGKAVWKCELNSYGKVRNFQGQYRTDCPFRYQGQYEDGETGLYYNRFRYYSPEEGVYISQDPIRLAGGMNIYSYVHDTNGWVDIFGLVGCEIDWSRRRGDGDTSEQHVRKHEVDNGTKPKHGVFADDAIDTTNSAWDRVQSEGIEGTRQPNGNDIYVVPYMEAGLQGGSSGDASILNNVTIITEGGTNKIVTAFPS